MMVSYMIPEISKSRTGQESIEGMSGCRGPWRDNGAPGVSSNGQKQSQTETGGCLQLGACGLRWPGLLRGRSGVAEQSVPRTAGVPG